MIGFENVAESLVFNDRAELQGYLDRLANIDKWYNPFINEMSVGSISTEMELKIDPTLKYEFGFFSQEVEVDPDDRRNLDCVENAHGVFVLFPDPSGKGLGIRAFPTHPMCYRTLLQRSGDECRTMLNWDDKKTARALPVREKMERISSDFRLYSQAARALVRDGVCMVARSADYAVLPAGELVYEVEDMLQKEHPDYEFSCGSASDEFLVAEYYLNEDVLEEKVREIIAPGSDKRLRAGIRFATSDVGLSAATVKPFYEYDKKVFTVGAGLYLPHSGNASVAGFRDLLDKIGGIFRDNEDILEALYLVKVSSVRTVLEGILEKYAGSFPKAQAEEVAQETDPGPGAAIDVYIALSDIAERAGKKAGPNKQLALCDLVERLVRLPFDKIDKGEEWEKV